MNKILRGFALLILLAVVAIGMIRWAMPTPADPFPARPLTWEQTQIDLTNGQVASVRFMETDSSHVVINLVSGDIVLGEMPYCKGGLFSECNTAGIQYSGAVAALSKATVVDKASSGPMASAETNWLAYRDGLSMNGIGRLSLFPMFVFWMGVMLGLFAMLHLVLVVKRFLMEQMSSEATARA